MCPFFIGCFVGIGECIGVRMMKAWGWERRGEVWWLETLSQLVSDSVMFLLLSLELLLSVYLSKI